MFVFATRPASSSTTPHPSRPRLISPQSGSSDVGSRPRTDGRSSALYQHHYWCYRSLLVVYGLIDLGAWTCGGDGAFKCPLGPTSWLAGAESAVECVDLGSMDYHEETGSSFVFARMRNEERAQAENMGLLHVVSHTKIVLGIILYHESDAHARFGP